MAVCSDWPTAEGTTANGGPLEIPRMTFAPRASLLWADGCSLTTVPFGFVDATGLGWGTSPAFASADTAFAIGIPTTFGTATRLTKGLRAAVAGVVFAGLTA